MMVYINQMRPFRYVVQPLFQALAECLVDGDVAHDDRVSAFGHVQVVEDRDRAREVHAGAFIRRQGERSAADAVAVAVRQDDRAHGTHENDFPGVL